MYSLQHSNVTLQLPPNLEQLVTSPTIDGVFAFHFPSCHLICARYGSFLIGFEYQEESGTWEHLWEEQIVERRVAAYDFSRYPHHLTNLTTPGGSGEEVLILRHGNGVRFYRVEETGAQTPPILVLLSEDSTFADIYNWGDSSTTFLWGRIFPNQNLLGLVTRKSGHVKFYSVLAQRVFKKEPYPMGAFNLRSPLDTAWSSSETEFFVLGIQSGGGDVIGLRTPEALLLYQFNAQYQLVQLQSVPPLLPLSPNLLRPVIFLSRRLKSRGGAREGVLECDASGVSIFGYDPRSSVYEQQYEYRYDGGTRRTMDCKSLFTVDLNGDAIEEVVLRTERGLELLSFHDSTNRWTSVLHKGNLRGQERFLDVVGALPLAPTPTLFTFDSESNSLRTAHLLPFVEAPTLPPTTTTTTANTATAASALFPTPRLIPPQIPRTHFHSSELGIGGAGSGWKRVRRWAEQWEATFIKEAVKVNTGQVEFSVPLVDVITEAGLGVQLPLLYSSLDGGGASKFLGVGWTLPLATDVITFTSADSIFPKDGVYSVETGGGEKGGGRSKQLQEVSRTNRIIVFKQKEEPDADVTYTLWRGSESSGAGDQWVVESASERIVYGGNTEAVQTSLMWPNWRGAGKEWATLAPYATAWHLTEHHSKAKNASLFYHYASDQVEVGGGKHVTGGVRLIRIQDDALTTSLTFHYSLKNKEEYESHRATDGVGSIKFPVKETHSQFLSGCTLQSFDFDQQFHFVYTTTGRQRLLKEIQQLIHNEPEKLLSFNYESRRDEYFLVGAVLPSGLTVDYTFENQPLITCPPMLPALQRSPVPEAPSIAYGSDYVVLAHKQPEPSVRDESGRESSSTKKIVVRVVDQVMAKVFLQTTTDQHILGGKDISHFVLNAFKEYFTLLLFTPTHKIMALFSRHNGTWTENGTSVKYIKKPKGVIIRQTEAFLVCASPAEGGLIMFEYSGEGGGGSGWSESSLPSAPIKRLVLHSPNRLFTYDDRELRVLSRPHSNSTWTVSVVRGNLSLGGLVSGGESAIRGFDLSPEKQSQMLDALSEDGLQVLKNLVVLSGVRLTDGVMFLLLRILLLSPDNRVVKEEEHIIQRKEVLSMEKTLDAEGSQFLFGYVRNATSKFQLQLKGVSGKVRENVDKVGNKNKRQDALEKLITQLRDSDDFRTYCRNNVAFDWASSLQVVLNGQGIHVGNDTTIALTGTSFARETPSKTLDVQLGSRVFLQVQQQSPTDSYTLFRTRNRSGAREAIKTFALPSGSRMANAYPLYMAWQQETGVKVQIFKNSDTLGAELEFPNELLLLQSNIKTLLTLRNVSGIVDHAEPQEVLARPTWSFLPQSSRSVVRSVRETAGSTVRQMGYERSFNFTKIHLADDACTETLKIIPGDDKSISGWQESSVQHHYLGRGDSKNMSSSVKWFDSNGTQVFLPPDENEDREDETKASGEASDLKKKDSENTGALRDASGELLISNFSPYRVEEGEVGFIGFESYESTNAPPWRFNLADVVKQGFAFTGSNFLRLQSTGERSTAGFEGSFTPLDQTGIYLVSTWLRTFAPSENQNAPGLSVKDVVPWLRVLVSTAGGEAEEVVGLLGEVKRTARDWAYAEVLINFKIIQQIYLRKLKKEAGETSNSNQNATFSYASVTLPKFQIRVLAGENLGDNGRVLDLDHVRFSPLEHEFQATVFDPRTRKPTFKIETNGLVTRTLYETMEAIGSINDEFETEKIVRHAKTGHRFPVSIGHPPIQPPSTLTIEPQSGGFYEDFDPYAFRNRWTISAGQEGNWKVGPGQLWHVDAAPTWIHAHTAGSIDAESAALRCFLGLTGPASELTFRWSSLSLKLNREESGASPSATLSLFSNGSNSTELVSFPSLPLTAEYILVLEMSRIFVWVDSVLVLDHQLANSQGNQNSPWTSFGIEAKGRTLLQDCFFLNRPAIKVEYKNEWGDKTQTIQLEDESSALVSQVIYDSVGRGAIQTKTTRVTRKANETLLTFQPYFVNTTEVSDPHSVWRTELLGGEVSELNPSDGGRPYYRKQFDGSPLNQETVKGLPGANFGVSGRYSKKLSRESGIPFLANYFPYSQGYRQKTERTPDGNINVSVFDSRKNRVGVYVHSPGYDHILSTYEYDSENRLVKILSPNYHHAARTFSKTRPWQAGDDLLTSAENEQQQLFGTHFTHDSRGLMTSKKTPDAGTVQFFYNDQKKIRYLLFQQLAGASNQTEAVTFMEYDSDGQLTRSGHLTEPVTTAQLTWLGRKRNVLISNAVDHQQFFYSDVDANPLTRGRLRRYVTYNDGQPLVEQLEFNSSLQMLVKQTLALPGKRVTQTEGVSTVKREFRGGRLRTLTYPHLFNGHPLRLVHRYNRQGQLIALAVDGSPNDLFRFEYSANGLVSSETHFAHSNVSAKFRRDFTYTSAGYLEAIVDPFMSQQLQYTTGGYGQEGNGQGNVMSSTFTPTWTQDVDTREFEIRDDEITGYEHSEMCVDALKRQGFLTVYGNPRKPFLPSQANQKLPLLCGGKIGNRIAQVMAEKEMTVSHGHAYSYGNHGELIRAKYFTADTKNVTTAPLQPNSFSEQLPGISPTQSFDIWKILSDANFIHTDQRKYDQQPSEDFGGAALGKPGRVIFPSERLQTDLGGLHEDYTIHKDRIGDLLLHSCASQTPLELNDLKTRLFDWEAVHDSLVNVPSAVQQSIATKAASIFGMLSSNGYLRGCAFDERFTSALSNYTSSLPAIYKVLRAHFLHNLGTHPFDLESYDIDPNGNHKKFYSGFNRYEIAYINNSNKIQFVQRDSPSDSGSPRSYPLLHDARGNVVQAMHLGIKRIAYDPVSQRTTAAQMLNGSSVKFSYDSQGERILKQVIGVNGQVVTEVTYVRDDEGRVLTDTETTFSTKGEELLRTTTMYLYGPRGLLGFIRNKAFYSVLTDHAGSARLVVKDRKVVAAYDYLPYGEHMRIYEASKDARLRFRFTGQEWDAETKLYNYHARLYDPSIGRFYQVDPQAQYFSPYIYGGNSPVSLVDPDGEFFISLTLSIVGAVVGAYLGAAAANNRWNPLDWDFSDHGTWLGLFGGGLAGGLLPLGFAASVAAIGTYATISLGVAAAYLTTAAANGNWDPSKWAWDRPHTFNALFQGFATGSGIVGGIKSPIHFAKETLKLSNRAANVFVAVSFVVGGGVMYAGGVTANDGKFGFWEWDWTSPSTYSALVDGFDSGFGWPQGFYEISKGLKSLGKNPGQILDFFGKLKSSKGRSVIAIFGNPKHPLFKTVAGGVMAYLMGSSANSNFDITSWNWASFGTYEGILNGIFFGKDVDSLLTYVKDKKAQKALAKAEKVPNKNSVATVPWFMTLEIAINAIVGSNKKTKFNDLMAKVFSNAENDASFKKLVAEAGADSDAVQKAREFIRDGESAYLKGTNDSPELLRKILDDRVKVEVDALKHDLIEVEESARRAHDEDSEVRPDRELEEGNVCGLRGGRRKKRARDCSMIMYRDLAAEEQFLQRPTQFLSENIVSASRLDSEFMEQRLLNGAVYNFYMDTGTDGVNILRVNPIEAEQGIRGYLLGTGETISIDLKRTDTRFIFTPELGGCTLYTRINPDTGHMDVFHHRRNFKHETPGGKTIKRYLDVEGLKYVYEVETQKGRIEKFDQALTWEDYAPPEAHRNEIHAFGFQDASTPFLYRMPDGQWMFMHQQIERTFIMLNKERSKMKAVYQFGERKVRAKPAFFPDWPADTGGGRQLRSAHFIQPASSSSAASRPTHVLPHLIHANRLLLSHVAQQATRMAQSVRSALLSTSQNHHHQIYTHQSREREPGRTPPHLESPSSRSQNEIWIQNCVPWAAFPGGKFNRDAITCYAPQGKALLFPYSSQAVSNVSNSSANAGHMKRAFTSDQFGHFRPIEFNGQPSVGCTGEKSYLVYTPHPTPLLFDNLDGNLMLARVLPAAVNQLASALSWAARTIFGGGSESAEESRTTLIVTEKQRNWWETRITQIETHLRLLLVSEGKGGEDEDAAWRSTDFKWAVNLVEDIKTDIEELCSRSGGGLGGGWTAEEEEVEFVEGRLDGLYEELEEVMGMVKEREECPEKMMVGDREEGGGGEGTQVACDDDSTSAFLSHSKPFPFSFVGIFGELPSGGMQVQKPCFMSARNCSGAAVAKRF